MRTLGFRTHVLFAMAAAAGLVASMSRPWYASAPIPDAGKKGIGDINGPLNSFFAGLERWVTADTGTSAWTGLEHVGIAIAAMAAVAGLGAFAALSPRVQVVGREALRYGAFVAVAIVVWKLLDPPGDNAATELRYGAFIALGCALILVSCSTEISNSPLRGRRKPAPYMAPPAPPVPAFEAHGSAPPPGA